MTMFPGKQNSTIVFQTRLYKDMEAWSKWK